MSAQTRKAPTRWEAVVFDFDGLILDTETPLYLAWAHTFAEFGADPIDLGTWTQALGRADNDPLVLDPVAALEIAIDRALDRDHVEQVRRPERDRLSSPRSRSGEVVGARGFAQWLRRGLGRRDDVCGGADRGQRRARLPHTLDRRFGG